jgi:hypothetical protein
MCNEREPLDCSPGAYLERSDEMLFRLTNGQDDSICLRYSTAKSEEQRTCRNAKFWERSYCLRSAADSHYSRKLQYLNQAPTLFITPMLTF